MFWLFLGCMGDKSSFDYDLSASELDFGEVSQGMWSSQGIRVLNTGEENLTIFSVELTEEGSSVFSLDGEIGTTPLGPEDAVFLDVIFTPDSLSIFEGSVEFHTSSIRHPIREISLKAQGGPSIYDMDGDGYAPVDGDCNDDDASIFVGAQELCDGIDNDCDGALSQEEEDADGDGQRTCDGDCDDRDEDVFIGAQELCDGKDTNCDGIFDDVIDEDGDGQSICDGDCDDSDGGAYQGGIETCDGIDNDCDGVVDDVDEDGDGFYSCFGDCDDNNPLAFPVLFDSRVEMNGDGSMAAPFRSLSSAFEHLDDICRTVLVRSGAHELEGTWTGGYARILGGAENPEDTTIKPFSTNTRALRVLSGSTLVLENLTAFGGDSSGEGSFVLVEEGGVLELHEMVFFDNHSTENGGALAIRGMLYSWNTDFSYNTSDGQGGALFLDGGTFIDEGSSFIANEANQGGGIAAQNATITLWGSRLKGNQATTGGGAFLEDMSSIALQNVKIWNNDALVDGGGVAVLNPLSPYTLRNMHVQGNHAEQGGGIWIGGAQSVGIIANSTFVDNSQAIAIDSQSSSGGNYVWSNIFGYDGGLFLGNSSAGSASYNLCWQVLEPCLDMESHMDAGENITADPIFSNFIDDGALVGDDLSLEVGSPAVNTGPLDGEGPLYFQTWTDGDGSRNDRGYTGGF